MTGNSKIVHCISYDDLCTTKKSGHANIVFTNSLILLRGAFYDIHLAEVRNLCYTNTSQSDVFFKWLKPRVRADSQSPSRQNFRTSSPSCRSWFLLLTSLHMRPLWLDSDCCGSFGCSAFFRIMTLGWVLPLVTDGIGASGFTYNLDTVESYITSKSLGCTLKGDKDAPGISRVAVHLVCSFSKWSHLESPKQY